MDIIEKELFNRKKEIQKEIELLFETNMKITDWDVPEANDQKAAEILLTIMEEQIVNIRADVQAGKYKNY